MAGRKKIYQTKEELEEHKRLYRKEYYNANKSKFWSPDKQKPKINYVAIDNSINRLMQNNEFILRFINTIGSDRLLSLMGYEETC
ncbi:hypothetical protein EON78_01485 [bacterium]|nr:MAG: hypothetical protein EON78_01485 [bacterium]